jgi:hypothetical protein
MNDPTDPAVRPSGSCWTTERRSSPAALCNRPYGGAGVPELVLRIPAARVHWPAHVITDNLRPGSSFGPTDRALGRTLDAAAAAMGDFGAMACALQQLGGVGTVSRRCRCWRPARSGCPACSASR